MRKIIISFLFISLSYVQPVNAQDTGNDGKVDIRTVADLKTAVNSNSFMHVVMNMREWFPGMVSSLDWKTQMSKRFLLLYHIDYHDSDDTIFETFLDESENIYEELAQFFKLEAHSKQDSLALKTRLICVIVKTKTERTFGSLTDPHHLFYFLDTKQDPSYMKNFRHEYAHWAWGRLFGEAPSLFNEGIAVYAENMSACNARIDDFLKVSVDFDAVPPLSEIAFNENFWKHRGMYTAGGLLVHYLVGKYGWEPLKKLFLLSEFEDNEILEHFQQVYGKRLQDVDIEWRQYYKSKMN